MLLCRCRRERDAVVHFRAVVKGFVSIFGRRSGFCGFGGILKNLEPTTEWIGKSAWETS